MNPLKFHWHDPSWNNLLESIGTDGPNVALGVDEVEEFIVSLVSMSLLTIGVVGNKQFNEYDLLTGSLDSIKAVPMDVVIIWADEIIEKVIMDQSKMKLIFTCVHLHWEEW